MPDDRWDSVSVVPMQTLLLTVDIVTVVLGTTS